MGLLNDWRRPLLVFAVNALLAGGLLLFNYLFALRPMLIFRVVVATVMIQFQLYLRERLVRPLCAAQPASRAAAIQLLHAVFALFSAVTPVFMMSTRGPLMAFGLICYFSNVWLFFLLLLAAALRWLLGRCTTWSRRRESQVIVAAVLLLTLAAYREAQLEFQVNRVPVPFAGFAGAQRLTVTHISDVHLGPVLGLDFCQRVLAASLRLDSDLLVITGDLFDIRYAEMADAVPLCIANLTARHGVFFVTGNHDHYTESVHQYLVALRRHGVHVLDNRCHRVTVTPDLVLDIVGVNDLSAARTDPKDAARVPDALASCGDSRLPDGRPVPRLFLAHQPNHIDEIAAHTGRVPTLVLSGHTHAGQVFPITWLVHLANRYTQGLARHNDHVQIFVSRGTGQWGPPLRLGARAEIVQLELHA